jgi:hypothetical protein
MSKPIAEIQFDDWTIVVHEYRPAIPGRTYGPPEDCYPEDPAELDYTVFNENGDTVNLSNYMIDLVEDVILEHFKAEAEAYADY